MLSVVIVSFNRRDALSRTLTHVLGLRPDEVIVADNGSADGTTEMLREQFPSVRLLALGENLGVEAFNRGVRAATGDAVLILDDDSWPDEPALRAALAALASSPEVGAVTLHPRHPATNASEWPFAHAASHRWPVMGCGNLVRADAWKLVGGYEPGFFLYRNDADLALKLLGAGLDVVFDPAWVVWHDSPAAARKSERWLHLATRNWIWMARRHGRGVWKWIGIAAGVLASLRKAGPSAARLRAWWRGASDGLRSNPPPLTASVGRTGEAWRAFMRTRLSPTSRAGS